MKTFLKICNTTMVKEFPDLKNGNFFMVNFQLNYHLKLKNFYPQFKPLNHEHKNTNTKK